MAVAPRRHFATRLGFVLAAAGSAVGLGNIWKFPYMTGQNGGGAFLIIYLIFVFTIGLSVMLAEFTIGRAGQKDPVGSFAKLKGGPWVLVGYLGVAAGFIILSFYSVVAGWSVAYVVKAVFGNLASTDAAALGTTFKNFISAPIEPIVYHGFFMLITMGVILGGVSHGIERMAKVLMPALFVLVLILIVRAVTLDGAAEGLAFFFNPDFTKVTWNTVSDALGQAFFSLSLGMGAMITYGSYLSKKANLPKTASYVVLLDTGVAILAGMMILPAVFAFGFNPEAGPGLVFITLPAVFSAMPLGQIFAILFFILLAIAALTSAVSLLEVVVGYLVDEKGMRRSRVTYTAGTVIFLLGIPSSLSVGVWSDVTVFGKGFLDLLDYIASNIMLPLGGVFIALFVGWVAFPVLSKEAHGDGTKPFALAPVWHFICRFIAPIAIGWVLVVSTGLWGWVIGLFGG